MNIDTINELIDQNIYENTEGAITASSLKAVLKAITGAIIPLITLTDEHARSLYMQAVGAGGDYSCPELDNLTELGVYRLNANVLQVPVSGAEELVDVYMRTTLNVYIAGGYLWQTFRSGAYTFERTMIVGSGEWGNWSAIG